MEWEYLIQNFAILDRDDALEEAQADLNALGAEGWEIFSVMPGPSLPVINKNAQSWLYAFAKRPCPSLITASEMATNARVDPKAFREALRNANLMWHGPNEEWTALFGSHQHMDMERVLRDLLKKLKSE